MEIMLEYRGKKKEKKNFCPEHDSNPYQEEKKADGYIG